MKVLAKWYYKHTGSSYEHGLENKGEAMENYLGMFTVTIFMGAVIMLIWGIDWGWNSESPTRKIIGKVIFAASMIMCIYLVSLFVSGEIAAKFVILMIIGGVLLLILGCIVFGWLKSCDDCVVGVEKMG